MEPIFKREPYSALVPQLDIVLGNEKKVSILDAGHRLGDALIRASDLADKAREAFEAFIERGDATLIARLAPTSLVFGAWDSRGGGAKLPRLVNSVIRAWEIDVLHRAAQYVPPVDYVLEGELVESDEKKENDARSQLGFRHAPAIWRDEERTERVLGGIVARGGIYRDVTINMIALRALDGSSSGLRRYILGLALVAANEPQDGFLRQGCLLTPDPESPAIWTSVARSGEREQIKLTLEQSLAYAKSCAADFGIKNHPPVRFDPKKARTMLDQVKKKKGKSAETAV
jgi:CRISPR-associated protein Csb1